MHAIVSRLIADDGLPASHDQPTGTIVVHHVEPTRLQVGCCGSYGCADAATRLIARLLAINRSCARKLLVLKLCPWLQTLAGTFSDKASLLVDLNERALAMRTGMSSECCSHAV